MLNTLTTEQKTVYKDYRTAKKHLQAGRDFADWMTVARGYDQARREAMRQAGTNAPQRSRSVRSWNQLAKFASWKEPSVRTAGDDCCGAGGASDKSDREVGRIVGVHHQTVGKVRGEIIHSRPGTDKRTKHNSAGKSSKKAGEQQIQISQPIWKCSREEHFSLTRK
jgi:hypothetical protein